MATQVLKFDQSVKAYQRLVDTRLENGDLQGALSVLLHLKNKSRNVNILKDIAQVYEDLELYELSVKYWFKYLGAVNKRYRAEAFKGLGNCYFYLGNLPVSSYYFNENVIASGKTIELNEEMFNIFSNMMEDEEPNLKFVHPPRSVDCQDIMRDAKDKMVEGKLTDAIALYSEVQKGNADYEEARCQIAVAYFMKGDVDFAIAIAKDIVNTVNPHSIFALCTLTTMCSYKGNTEESGYFYRQIDEKYAKNSNDIYKVATCAIEKKDYDRAHKNLKKLLEEKPFDKNLNFICAIVEFNTGNKQDALDRLSKIIQIYEHDSVYEYYYDYIKSRQVEKVKKPLEYFYRLPKDEEERRYKIIKEILNKKDRNSAIKKIRQNYELIDWCLASRDIQYQHTGAYLLAIIGDRFSDSRFLDLLLSPTIHDEVKEYIIKLLAIEGFNKTVGVVLSNVYKDVVFRDVDMDCDDYSMPFIEAYAKAFSYLTVYTDFDARKLHDTTLETHALFGHDPNVYSTPTVETLSAVLYLKSGYEDLSSLEEVAKDFETDVKSIKTLLTYMENTKWY